MREIKFRAWRENEEIMIPFDKLHVELEDGECTVWYGVDGDDLQYARISACFEFMQCAGIKDQNGKEIYEGDIVKLTDASGSAYSKVRWYNSLASWAFDIYLEGSVATTLLYCEVIHGAKDGAKGFDSIEVVGNIYENPALLE